MSVTAIQLEGMSLALVGTPFQGPQGEKGDTGAAGSDGADGSRVYFGVGVPSVSLGTTLDYYINTTNFDFYAKNSGAWLLIGNIKGADGEAGANGVAGVPGSDGADGRDPEFQSDGTYLQWRLVGDTEWQNLIEWITLKGDKGDTGEKGDQGDAGTDGTNGIDGTDGTDGATWLSGTATPSNANGNDGDFYLNTNNWNVFKKESGVWMLKGNIKGATGDAGTGLVNQGNWVSGTTYSEGSYVFATASGGEGTAMFILQGTEDYLSTIAPASDTANWVEFTAPAGQDGADGVDGVDGTDGREIEIQNNGTSIQWRYVGDTEWTDIVALVTLTGADGADGTNGTDGTDGVDGTDGNTILTTSGQPSDAVGNDGDYAIDIATFLIYGPKTGGAWSAGVSFKGEDGADGTGSGGSNVSLLATDPTDFSVDGALFIVVNATGIKLISSNGTEFTTEASLLFSTDAADFDDHEGANNLASPQKIGAFLQTYGLASTFITTATHLNNKVRNGFWTYDQNTQNLPAAGTYGRGFSIAASPTYVTQFAIENDSGTAYIRYNNGGTWSSWTELSGGASGGGGDPKNTARVSGEDVGTTSITPTAVLSVQSPGVGAVRIRAYILVQGNDTGLVDGNSAAIYSGIVAGIGGTSGWESIATQGSSINYDGSMTVQSTNARDQTREYGRYASLRDNLIIIEGVGLCTYAGTITLLFGSDEANMYCAIQKGSFLEAELIS